MRKESIGSISVFGLFFAATGQARVVGDFEGGLERWVPGGDATLTLTTVGATAGCGRCRLRRWRYHP